MDDEPHVRLVDPHAEGVRRHNGTDVLVHEAVLHLVPMRIVEARMVGGGRDPRPFEDAGDAFDVAARGGVHHREALVLSQGLHERVVLLGVVPCRRTW
jgi:hypothetical protein